MLKPIVTEPRVRPVAAFDVQGDGRVGMVVGSMVTAGRQESYTEACNLVGNLTSRSLRGFYVYSHRLTYDAGVLVPWLPDDSRLFFINEKLFKGRLSDDGKHATYLGDSSGLWGGLSLSDVAADVGCERLFPPEVLVRRRGGGGRHSSVDGVRAAGVQDYSLAEASIVYRGMDALQSELLSIGGELKDTLASTAMNLFRRKYLDAEYYTPYDYRNEFARGAYYGGRCEPYVLGWWDGVNVYDVNSSYPSVMRDHDYPDPNSLVGPCSPGRVGWIMDYEGCSDCTVDVPYMKYPVLPYRVGGQTFFPVGIFRGTWCHNELRYAVERGVRIKEVHYTLYSERAVRPFDSYVNDLWRLRQQLKAQGSPRALIYKLLLNSLGGKFGQRPEGGLSELQTMPAYERAGHRGGVEFLELCGEVYARIPIATKRMPDYIIVPWSAYITAYARIDLHRLMLDVRGPVLYVDTDSVHTFDTLRVGDGLGELSLKFEDCVVEIIAPKMYDLVTGDGERKPVAKGVPHDAQGEFCTYKEVNYWKALNWIEAARLKLEPSVWLEMKKRLQGATPKRRYKKLPTWKGDMWISEPPVVNELPRPRQLPRRPVSPAAGLSSSKS